MKTRILKRAAVILAAVCLVFPGCKEEHPHTFKIKPFEIVTLKIKGR